MSVRMVRLGDVCTRISDGTHQAPKWADNGVPFLFVSNIRNGRISFETNKFVSREDYTTLTKNCPIEARDVLYTAVGSYGNSAVVPSGRTFIFQRHIAHLKPQHELVDSTYLAQMLETPAVRRQADKLARGVAQKTVTLSSLRNFEIPLPPLNEQKRIAAILDKADALRAKRRQAIALLDSLTQSIFLEMFGDPVSNPKGWPMTKLGEICTFRGGAQPPKTVFSYEDGPEKIRLIQIRDYKSDRFKTFVPISMAKRFCDETDIMIGRYGPPVFQILKGIRGSYNVALMKAEPKPGINKSFLFYLLCSHRLQNDVIAQSQRTAGQTGVNLDYLNEYVVPRPSWNAQEEFRACMELVEDKLVQAQRFADRSDSLFASLQHRAFTGQL
ncbi:MAG TPA: restriction endonuclease subunit S [Ensifer sp.]|nr:restriction endonuclease subunit S [Ensifer sp.]